jgi:serine/threonine protein kinase
MALISGTKLGPYEIESPLGAGGMGEVYRAWDTRLDRTVAIKVLVSHLSSLPELKQRMEREARAISALNHPNICHLYDIGQRPAPTTSSWSFSKEKPWPTASARARCRSAKYSESGVHYERHIPLMTAPLSNKPALRRAGAET